MIRNVKAIDLSKMEDFSEREVPLGVTDEDLVRAEFASDEEYQSYLDQQTNRRTER